MIVGTVLVTIKDGTSFVAATFGTVFVYKLSGSSFVAATGGTVFVVKLTGISFVAATGGTCCGISITGSLKDGTCCWSAKSFWFALDGSTHWEYQSLTFWQTHPCSQQVEPFQL